VPEIIQRSFTSGEISPSLQSRADIIKYSTGLNLCENFFVRAQGGVYSRPGLKFIGELGNSSNVGRLIPFSFNTEQTYMLVFEHLKMRVIKAGGYVLAGSGPAIFELTTPYTEAQLSRLSYTQNADVMTITHPSHDPRNLNRLADDNWTLTVISYASTVTAPTFAGDTVKTITGITQANPAVVTATGHTFSTGNIVDIAAVVGMTEVNGRSFRITVIDANSFQLDGEDSTLHSAYTSGGTATRTTAATTVGSGFGTYDKTYTYVVTAVDSDGVESLASSSSSITTGSLSVTGGVRLSWGAVSGASYYRIYKDPSNNTQVFGWIGDSNNNTFDDYNIAPITSDAPPEDRQPFTAVDDKPAVVSYYQQRQVFANTNNEPQATFTTQTNNFNSLRTSNPARDDDAVTFTIAAQQVNEIRHIISLDAMILLTSGGEWKVTEGRDEVLTPSTIGARIQSYNGASWVKPVIVNSTALYLQEKSARIRDLGYEFSSDKYTGNDLSLMSEHLFEDQTILEMAFAAEPYGILWCVRNDGVMLGLTYQREQQVWGWHHHTTGAAGEFESVATISEDNRDATYVIVKRTINGSTVRYVERIEKRESKIAEDAFYVDSGLSYNGISAVITGAIQSNPVVITTITSHNYSNGESVRIEDVVGMTELNDNVYIIANVTATTFELSGVDGTLFTAYTTGGNSLIVITTVSGLDHLEGETVDILADGYVVEGKTVSSGSVTLDRAANKVHAGLSYTPTIELLDIDTAQEQVKSKSVSVSKVFIEVEGSRGGFVGGRKDATSGEQVTFQEIKPRFDADGYDQIALRTYKQEVVIDPQWSKGGGVRIEQRSPLPMAILSVIPRVDVGGS